MAYNTLSFDYRLAENIKNYTIDSLYDKQALITLLSDLAKNLDIELMLTDRHGKPVCVTGGFTDITVNVETDPGIKIRVCNRTIGHLYVTGPDSENSLVSDIVSAIVLLGEQSYRFKESSLYIDELEGMVKKADERRHHSEKSDPLTGVMNKAYFNKRSAIIDRSDVVPVAVINANINDWKRANDAFGDEGSDRLIRLIAEVLKREAKPEYVIGRIDGDVFAILIPIPEDGEAEDYISRIQKGCDNIEDPELAPSIAVGLVYKTNVEETVDSLLSDAEYLMFENKLEIKNSEEYQKRLSRAFG